MNEQKYTIVFKKSPDYRIYPAQVIFGGPVPDGSGILVNFGVDHHPMPSYVQFPIDKDSGLIRMQNPDEVAQVGNAERELLGALYITVEQAKRTVIWLNEQIIKAEGLKRD
jgi:hypothetical protein